MDRWSNLTYHSGHSGRNCLTDFITIVNMVDLLLVNKVASNDIADDATVTLWDYCETVCFLRLNALISYKISIVQYCTINFYVCTTLYYSLSRVDYDSSRRARYNTPANRFRLHYQKFIHSCAGSGSAARGETPSKLGEFSLYFCRALFVGLRPASPLPSQVAAKRKEPQYFTWISRVIRGVSVHPELAPWHVVTIPQRQPFLQKAVFIRYVDGL